MAKIEKNNKKTNVITFANMKGGVGKTTSSINIGACLGKLGYKTLIIDCDYQANASASLNLLAEGVHSRRNLFEGVVLNKRKFKDAILKTGFKNLDMVTSKFQLYYFSIANDLNSDAILKAWLTKATLNEYEYVIIDSRPELGTLFSNVMNVTDFVVIPITAEPDAVMGLSIILHHLAKAQRVKKDLKLLGVLYTMFREKTSVHKNFKPIINSVLEEQGILNLGTFPYSDAIKKAAAEFKPVIYSHVNKELPVHRALKKITKEIVAKIKATSGRAIQIPTIPIVDGEESFLSMVGEVTDFDNSSVDMEF